MKNISTLLVLFAATVAHVFAINTPASLLNNHRSAGRQPVEISLFLPLVSEPEIAERHTEVVSGARYYKLDKQACSILLQREVNFLRLSLPVSGGVEYTLELAASEILAPGFQLTSSLFDGKPLAYSGGMHYWGEVIGHPGSLVAFSIYEGEAMGLISIPAVGNIVVGKLEGRSDEVHIVYNDKDLKIKSDKDCMTNDDLDISGSLVEEDAGRTGNGNCIRLYWEVNKDIHDNKGGVTQAANYVIGLFNQSAILFANDSLPVQLSEVFVWNTTSPYTGTTTSGLLSQFQSYRPVINGDLGHLLGYVGNGGIAAGFNGLCASSSSSSKCYSDINSSYSNVPTYSWSVEVVTHEQGHLMGSRHTHACVWNGNNTAIDNCGPTAGYSYEGGCSNAPTPTGGGTVMSYCHLVGGVGINFANGFGPQPRAAMLTKYNNATCLQACATNDCLPPYSMSTSALGTTSITLNWTASLNAQSYEIRYRQVGSGTWSTVTTSLTSYTLTGLTPGVNYEWQILTVCTVGSSSWSIPLTFITIPLSCDAPTNTYTSDISYYGAKFNWNAMPGATGYTVRFRQTGTSTWTSAATSLTYYWAYTLSDTTQYEWQVSTNCSGGGTSAYSSSVVFTTYDTPPPPCQGSYNNYTTNITANSAVLNFGGTIGGSNLLFNIRYRLTVGGVWDTIPLVMAPFTLTGLTPSTQYEWQVQPDCDSSPQGEYPYSQSVIFTTLCESPEATVNYSGNYPGFCQGMSVTLYANTGSYTYQWLLNGNLISGQTTQFISVTTAGNYQVIVSQGACADTSSQLSIVSYSNPVLTLPPSQTICAGSTVTLTASGASTWYWTPPIGLSSTNTASVQATPPYDVTYTVVGWSQYGCSSSGQISLTVQNCVPLTQLRSTDCGYLLFNLQSSIVANAVTGATQYEFEFRDAQGINLIATRLQTSRTLSLSNVIPALQWGTQYSVKVRAYIGTSVGAYATACVIGIVQDPAVVGVPPTQLRSADCGRLNFTLSNTIYANQVSGATQYEFEFRDATASTVVATKLQVNYYTTLSGIVPSLQWGTQYSVRVRAYIGNYAGNYGPACIIGLIPDPAQSGVPNTQLSSTSCGATNLGLAASITCITVQGATQYNWEFSNPSTLAVIATKNTTGVSLQLSTVTPALQWGTTYNVRVRAVISGIVGNYSTVCTITTMPDPATNGVPDTRLNSASCTNQTLTLSSSIVALSVNGATQYEFEFSNPSTLVVWATKISNSSTCFLSQVTPALLWGTQYRVRVRAIISGIVGNYGQACIIGIIPDPALGVPSTQLRSSDCGKLTFTATSSIVADAVAGATQYEFEFRNPGNNNLVATKIQTSRTLALSSVTPALPVGQYHVRVRAYINSFQGSYGPVCLIGIVSSSREVVLERDVKTRIDSEVQVYPNPVQDRLFVQMKWESEPVFYTICDFLGRSVKSGLLTNVQNSMMLMELPPGLYYLKIEGIAAIQLIKQ